MCQKEVLRACGFEEEMLRLGVTSGFAEKESERRSSTARAQLSVGVFVSACAFVI